MKKISILLITFFFMIIMTMQVKAADPINDLGFDKIKYICPAPFQSVSNPSVIKSSGSLINYIRQDFPGICVNTKLVDGLIDVDKGAFYNSYWYCGPDNGKDWIVPFDGRNGGYYTRDVFWPGVYKVAHDGPHGCCPRGFAQYYEEGGYNMCCPDNMSGLGSKDLNNLPSITCKGITGKLPLSQKFLIYSYSFDSALLYENNIANMTGNFDINNPIAFANKDYVCSSMCTYKGSIFDPRLEVSEVDVNQYKCIKNAEVSPIDNTKVCVEGVEYFKLLYDAIGLKAIQACDSETEPINRVACLACFDKNNQLGSNSFMWSSLGCVDVSRNGVITRVFQIGIGIIGGFAVWKIISAAIMFQQPDPSKHQIAKDELTSVLWAFIMMVGATVILNFIGFNILNIFPDGFL